MKLHELRPSPGSHESRKRVGRGAGSGHGKTSGRGQKGQGARTSMNLPKAFEGGQTKLTMRIPKLRGFKNRWKKTFAVVNLTRLSRFPEGTEVTPEQLIEAGMIKDVGAGIKVLGAGRLTHKLTIRAHRFSADARQKIEAIGGTVSVIEVPPPIRPKTKRAKNQPKPVPAAVSEEAAEKPSKAQKGAKPAKAEKTGKAEKSARAQGTGNAEGSTKAEGSPRADKKQKAPRPEKGEEG